MERRLAAIIAADIAGYSRLAGLDEVDTHRRLMLLRGELIEPYVTEHGGHVVSYAGDGMLAEFPSLVRAAECAFAIQRQAAEREPEMTTDRRISMRIGVHFGDVIASGGDIHGEGVNIAARLEQLAEPGGVCFSDRVHEEIEGKVAIESDYGGEPELKNIARRFGVWHWPTSKRGGGAPRILPPQDRPSIAVLPFASFGAQGSDDGIADGVVEDLTTALARLNWLFVTSRTSTFALKGLQIDAIEAGRRLGVRYLLEGSIRSAKDKVRITAQLIEARNGAHIWADNFDGNIDDLFDLQDKIVSSTIGAIEPTLLRVEAERVRMMRPQDVGAHHLYLRAMELMAPAFTNPNSSALEDAQGLLARAIELDPGYAPALALAGYFEAKSYLFGRQRDGEAAKRRAVDLVERAIQADPNEPLALGAYGFVTANAAGDLDRALAHIERALALNSNSPLLWNFAGEVHMYLSQHEKAIECLLRSMRLNPLDQRTVTNGAYLAFAFFFKRQPEESVAWAQRAVIISPNPLSYRILAASLAACGRISEARDATAHLLRLQPSSCLKRSRGANYRDKADINLYVDSLSKAGLPEEPTGILDSLKLE